MHTDHRDILWGMRTNSVDIPLGLHAGQVDIPWGTRAYQVDTQWDMLTHQGHIPYIRSLPTEQSVRLFPCGLILRRFCTKRKKLSDIDFLQRKFTANAKVQIPSAARTVTAEEVIVMKMTNREN